MPIKRESRFICFKISHILKTGKMDSEDDFSPDLPIPDTPLQSRTLLHYFTKTKPQDDKGNVSSHLKVKVNSSRMSKVGPEKSASQTNKSNRDNEKAYVNGQDSTLSTPHPSNKGDSNEWQPKERTMKQKRGYEITKEMNDECEQLPASKRVRSVKESPDTTCKSDNNTEIKLNKGINAFFKTVTKDEFRRECQKEAEKIKVTVTAMVHTPNIHKEHQLTPESNTAPQNPATSSTVQIHEKAERRKGSFSNVVRPNSETDTIKVISQEQIMTEELVDKHHITDFKINIATKSTTKENISAFRNAQAETAYKNLESGIDIPDGNYTTELSKQNKVSDKLFRKKKRKDKTMPDSEMPHKKPTNGVTKETDDSVDVDFFNMQAIIPNEKGLLSIDEYNIENSESATSSMLNTEDLDLSSPPTSALNTYAEQITSPKKKIPKFSCSIVDSKDTPTGKTQIEKNYLVAESKISNISENVGVLCTSVKENCPQNISCSISVEVASDKKPTPVSLFKHKDPPKRKYSKKAKASGKSNTVNGKAHVNYDSDSIDLDLLATYNAKTFHSAASGEIASNSCVLGKFSTVK